MQGPPGRTWDLRKLEADGRFEACFSTAHPQLPHLIRPKIHRRQHPGLSSALWGPLLRSSVTQGLLCKFLLSTLDLIAAINTNYASLSMKLRRTRLRGSSSIQGWRTNRTAIFNPGNVSRERAAWHCMCLSLLLQMESFTFQINISYFQLKVYERGKPFQSLRYGNTRNILPFRRLFSRKLEKEQGGRSSKQVPTAPRRLWFSGAAGLAMLALPPSLLTLLLMDGGVSRGSSRIGKNQTWVILDQGSANVFCKGPKSKYCRFFVGPVSLF